jgi:hypothetical protein
MSLPATAQQRAFRAEGQITIRSAGASGQAVGSLAVVESLSSTRTWIDTTLQPAATWDTTAAKTVEFNGQFSGSHADNHLRTEQLTCRVLG